MLNPKFLILEKRAGLEPMDIIIVVKFWRKFGEPYKNGREKCGWVPYLTFGPYEEMENGHPVYTGTL